MQRTLLAPARCTPQRELVLAQAPCNCFTGAAYPAGAGGILHDGRKCCVCCWSRGKELNDRCRCSVHCRRRREVLNWRRSNVRYRGCILLDHWSRSSVGLETSHVHVAGFVGVDGLLLAKTSASFPSPPSVAAKSTSALGIIALIGRTCMMKSVFTCAACATGAML